MPRPKESSKAKDFKSAILRLFKELKPCKVMISVAVVLSTVSSLLAIFTPNVLSKLTNKISEGLIINRDNLNTIYTSVSNDLNEDKIKDFTSKIIDLKKYPNPVKIFKEFSAENKGLDVAVECVGLPEIWEQIFDCVRPGGTVHFFGGCKSGSKVTFDTTKMHYGDIKMMSVFHHTPKYFRQALKYIESGDIEVEKLITDTLPLEKVEYAMEQHIAGKAIKFLINPWA